jgi:hypothetical protein
LPLGLREAFWWLCQAVIDRLECCRRFAIIRFRKVLRQYNHSSSSTDVIIDSSDLLNLYCDTITMTITSTSLPLGKAIPEGPHAISVQIPTWSDMCGMGRGDLQIMNALQNGYPRTFIHKTIQKVLFSQLSTWTRRTSANYTFSYVEYAKADFFLHLQRFYYFPIKKAPKHARTISLHLVSIKMKPSHSSRYQSSH